MARAVTSRPVEPLLSVAEAACVLGVSKRTFYRLIERGEISTVRVTTHQRIEPDVLREFIAMRKERR